MTTFRPWLVPTLAGPFATMWSFTTLVFLLFGRTQLLGERFDAWAVAMVVTGFIAAGHVVALLVADIVLLRARLRQLPTGSRAWLSSMASPFALQMMLMIPLPIETVPALALWILGSMLGAAFGVRLVLGSSPR
jgi:hypothetical protein